MDDLAQYPMALAACFFIMKMMWEYIKEIKNNKKSSDDSGMSENYKSTFYTQARKVDDVHNWLEKEDAEGKKLIYISSSYETSIKDNTKMLEGVGTKLLNLQHTIERIEKVN